MIYLYGLLGIVMLLPIMAGLQTSVLVFGAEQGELAMQAGDGKVLTDWESRQGLKSGFLGEQRAAFLSAIGNAGSASSVECPTVAPSGFVSAMDSGLEGECAYLSTLILRGNSGEINYLARVHAGKGALSWSSCLVIAGSGSLCPSEH